MSKPANIGSKSGTLGPAPTRLRQIALVARDLERAKQELVSKPSKINKPKHWLEKIKSDLKDFCLDLCSGQ